MTKDKEREAGQWFKKWLSRARGQTMFGQSDPRLSYSLASVFSQGSIHWDLDYIVIILR